ncbi:MULTISPECIES: xylose isomerase [Marinilactibacillus]|uniref:Xylose isomerase n=3 Tax=Marinilactibacillus TaxID=191769 RepID=A0A511H2H9_9LACT|nr:MULTISPECIES: xylose isomerase [Marinilactibacillus]TLQ07500.1 xylose isomerase [Marinilactibacillus psychrotolerans]SDD04971.1 D-xylose isomerase [Marinilactibacillus psychrotolerans]SFK13177.1 D-xylose isomerase [Marinilactibacillus piezotolerans]GEL67715.1 xylose isomerase [Marinilactibacillus psychrotolerans]GEQ33717.1 xylose isomerase [Marinilactibacillus psychrotolerans]
MEYFTNVKKVKYEGIDSKNPLAFKIYNAEEIIGGKTMEEHLKFSVAYWHTFAEELTDPFGSGTAIRPWDNITDPMEKAKAKVEAAFELFDKLNVPYFAFHDVDIAPEGESLKETFENMDIIVDLIKEKMETSKTKLLWNTVNNFSHPRFVHGAASSNNADVFAYAAAKVKKGLEVGKKLGSQSYVFWGGREGYESLLNTDMGLEVDNLGRFFHMAIDYASKIGYEGQFLIEPKPKEPTSHQYDFDVATTHAFLQKYNLDDKLKFNIEANHATLAGHSFEHELRYARINKMLGSVDANQGHPLLGWDTDEFPSDMYATTLAMYEILKNGGLEKGGLNFDSKVRRTSFEPEDLFRAHIVGMDSFALGLKVAHKMIEENVFENIIDKRYKSFNEGIGKDIVEGNTDFDKLTEHALNLKEVKNESGQLEVIKGVLNQYILQALSGK